MGYIYKITNLINGKLYIGKTILTVEERFAQHKQKASVHTNRKLYDAMNHYGYDNFSIEVIEECPDDKLNEREKYWIAYYDTYDNPSKGYNMTLGGDGGNTWDKNTHKLETGEKIREAHLKENYLPITKENLQEDINNCLSIEEMSKKYHSSPLTLNKRAILFFGKPISELRTIENTGQFKKIDIDKKLFYQDILQGLTTEELEDKYGMNRKTLRNRSREYFGKTYDEIRKENNIVVKNRHKENAPRGAKNSCYKGINDINTLTEMLKNDVLLPEISKYFNIGDTTLRKRIREIYNVNSVREARKYVKSQE